MQMSGQKLQTESAFMNLLYHIHFDNKIQSICFMCDRMYTNQSQHQIQEYFELKSCL